MADILTIYGIGGIGKTSLAKHIYGLYCREFQRSSYIDDITRKCNGNFNGLVDLQEQLFNEIYKTSSIRFHDVSIYTTRIENALARRRVFLVLDDITTLDQLDSLLGSKGFHPGSKVQLSPGYEEVSDNLVKYCQGHPLALKVLGKSLHNQDVAYWEGCIEGLMKETNSRINNVLRMSFDALPCNNDKELFKHIACFFVGIDKDVSETILNACDINTRSGITDLVDKCLLSIGLNNELKMHQLIQEMGRWEVRQESLDKPWKRSRLWCHEESFRVLKQKKGKGNVLGLALDMRMIEKEKLGASFELKTDAFSNMDNLMLLQLNYVHMNGSYENFPKELRGLCMHGFPLKSISLDLPMMNLVALDMSYSNIESFVGCDSNPRLDKRQKWDRSRLKDNKLLGSLKILNLSFCKQLRSLGEFEQLPTLERLIVRNCISLVEVCESIEKCVDLAFIDLSYCKKIEKLPRIIRC
ncbi:disease resistance protein RUN1-like [Lactuca sativa]|uniref:disease resistance protein RUN1-like n=1 Tax=Lactuca sativa TaxID=4236 RepID=UPI000CD98A83|nr:disease resistance protein RUN1-like [Lactuca sativa]